MSITLERSPIGPNVVTIDTWSPQYAQPNDEFDYIDITSVDRDKKAITGTSRIRAGEAPSRARQIVQSDDVLVSTVRPNLNAVAIVPEYLSNAIASTGFCVLRCHPRKLDCRYLFHWVRTSQFVADMVRQATGASYPAISDRIIKDSRIPLPPLSEQKRIADILDKADAIRRKRRETHSLQLPLLRSIFHELFGDPVPNQSNWERKPLGDLLASIDSGNSPRCLERQVTEDEWGILKLGSVTWCEYDPRENKAIPESELPNPDLEVKKGDLLFSRKNTYELVAAAAYVFETPPRLMLPDLIFRLRLRENAPVLTEYLWGLLTFPTKRRQIQVLAGGAAGSMPNISKARLLQQEVELPPKTLQRKYAERMHKTRNITLLGEIHQYEANDLFNSLVQRAFRGEL